MVTNLEETNQQREQQRRTDELCNLLKDYTKINTTQTSLFHMGIIEDKNTFHQRLGQIIWNNKILIWFAKPIDDFNELLRFYSDISVIAQHYLEKFHGRWEKIAPHLEHLFVENVSCFMLFDLHKHTIHSLDRANTPILMINTNSGNINKSIVEQIPIQLEKDSVILIGKSDVITEKLLEQMHSSNTEVESLKNSLSEIQTDETGEVIKWII